MNNYTKEDIVRNLDFDTTHESKGFRGDLIKKASALIAVVACAAACSTSPENNMSATPEVEQITSTTTPTSVEIVEKPIEIPNLGWATRFEDAAQTELDAMNISKLTDLSAQLLDVAIQNNDSTILTGMFLNNEIGASLSDALYTRFEDYSNGDYHISIGYGPRPEEVVSLLNESGSVIDPDLNYAFLTGEIQVTTGENAEIVDSQWVLFDYQSFSDNKSDANSWVIANLQFVDN